jgi:hypothetical protein
LLASLASSLLPRRFAGLGLRAGLVFCAHLFTVSGVLLRGARERRQEVVVRVRRRRRGRSGRGTRRR